MSRIVIEYYEDANDDEDALAIDTPDFRMGAPSIEMAEELLGRLERFISQRENAKAEEHVE